MSVMVAEKKSKDPCTTCHGTGHEKGKQAHSVHVKILLVWKQANKSRLAGQGEAGFNSGPYGDVYVVVSVGNDDKLNMKEQLAFLQSKYCPSSS